MRFFAFHRPRLDRFQIEPLEPRILLSADGALAAVVPEDPAETATHEDVTDLVQAAQETAAAAYSSSPDETDLFDPQQQPPEQETPSAAANQEHSGEKAEEAVELEVVPKSGGTSAMGNLMRRLWQEQVGTSSYLEAFFDIATGAVGGFDQVYASVLGSLQNPLATFDSALAALPANSAFSVNFAVGVENGFTAGGQYLDRAVSSFGALDPFGLGALGGASVEALGTGYNLSWTPGANFSLTTSSDLTGTWKLSRLYDLALGANHFVFEQFAQFGSLQNLATSDPVVLGVNITALTNSATARDDLLEILDLDGLASRLNGEVSPDSALSLSVSARLAAGELLGSNYTDQDTFAEALADIFVPYYGDTASETAHDRLAFNPVSSVALDYFDSGGDSSLGLLIKKGLVEVTAGAATTPTGNLWLNGGGNRPAYLLGNLFGEVSAGYGVETVTQPRNLALGTHTLQSPANRILRDTAYIRSSLDLSEITGVTVITHGFQPPVVGSGDSLLDLGRAIQNRYGGYLLDYDVNLAGAPGGFDLGSSSLVQKQAGAGYDVILLFDWAHESNTLTTGWGEAAGDALFNQLIALGLVDPALGADNPLELHFIGHSFGTAVTSEAIERLAAYDVPVDHVTYLDPHDFDQQNLAVDEAQRLFDLGLPGGYGATVWDNVAFADVYYQTRGDGVVDMLVPKGRPIPGAFNYQLRDGHLLPDTGWFDSLYIWGGTDFGGDHSFVWSSFYIATILGSFDGLPKQPESIPAEFGQLGYKLSRQAGGQPARVQWRSAPPSAVVRPNFTEKALGDPHTPQSYAADPSLNTIRFAPQWRPLENGIFHGDFEKGASATGLVPGWTHHYPPYARTGNFQPLYHTALAKIGDTGSGRALVFTETQLARTHNQLYVPVSAAFVQLQANAVAHAAADRLLVYLGVPVPDGATLPADASHIDLSAVLLGSVNLADLGNGLARFFIPEEFRNLSHALTLVVQRDALAQGADLELLVDNVRFEAGGRTGDLAAVDLTDKVGGDDFVLNGARVAGQNLSLQFSNLRGDAQLFLGTQLLGTILFANRFRDETFQEGGNFYLAPGTGNTLTGDVDPTRPGFQGTITLDFTYDTATQQDVAGSIDLWISDGFSATGAGAVTLDSGVVAAARLQQRLNFRAALDPALPGDTTDGSSKVLEVDGLIGARTRSALRNFQAHGANAAYLTATGNLDSVSVKFLNGQSGAVQTVLSAPEVERIRAQLPGLTHFASGLMSSPEMSAPLPLVGVLGPEAGNVPDNSVANITNYFNLEDVFQLAVVNHLLSFFSNSTSLTASKLITSLPGSVGGFGEGWLVGFDTGESAVLSESLGLLEWNLALRASRSLQLPLELGTAGRALGLELQGTIQVNLQFTFEADLRLKLERNANGTGQPGALQVGLASLEMRVEMDVPNINALGNIGALGIVIGQGPAGSADAANTNPAGNLHVEGVVTRAPGTIPYWGYTQMQGLGAADFDLVFSGEVAGELPVFVRLGNYATTLPRLEFALAGPGGSIFEGRDLALGMDWAGQPLSAFSSLTNSGLVGAFRSAGAWLADVTSLDVFGAEIPFLTNSSLASVRDTLGNLVQTVDFDSLFESSLLDRLEEEGGGLTFTTIQQLLVLVPGLSQLAFDPNPADPTLTFAIKLSGPLAAIQAPLDFSAGLGDLGGIQTSSSILISPELGIDLVIGFSLKPLGADFQGLDESTPLDPAQATAGQARINGGRAVPNLSDGQKDLVIKVGNNSTYEISLDGLSTIGGVIQAIETGTAGAVDVSISADGFSLVLTDTTGAFDQVFSVTTFGESYAGFAAIGLGIVDSDADGDGVIIGAALHGDSWSNRFFVQSGGTLTGLLNLAATNIEMLARLGFVGVESTGGRANIQLQVRLTLREPQAGTAAADGRIYLGELNLPTETNYSVVGARSPPPSGTLSNPTALRLVIGHAAPLTLSLAPGTSYGSLAQLATLINSALDNLSLSRDMADQLGLLGSDGTIADLTSLIWASVGQNALGQSVLMFTLSEESPAGFFRLEETAPGSLDALGFETGASSFGIYDYSFSGQASLTLPIELKPAIANALLGPEPKVIVSWSDLRDPSTLTFITQDLDVLAGLSGLVADTVADAFEEVGALLEALEQSAVFTTPIPLLNKSLRDLVDLSGPLADFIAEFRANPAATLQQLAEALEAALDPFTNLGSVTASLTGQRYVVNISADLAKVLQLPLNLDLASLLGLDDSLVSGTAQLQVTANVALDFQLILEVMGDSPGDIRFLLADDASFEVTLLADVSNIRFAAGFGALGIFVGDGGATSRIRISDGAGHPAYFRTILASAPGGAYDIFDTLDFGDLDTSYLSVLTAFLPVHFPTEGVPLDPQRPALQLLIRDILTLGALAQVPNINSAVATPANQIVLPDFGAALDALEFYAESAQEELANIWNSLTEGYGQALRLLEDALDGEVFGIRLPLIGDALRGSEFARLLRTELLPLLGNPLGRSSLFAQQALFAAFGPGGLNWLRPVAGSGAATLQDVLARR
jgi:hypothetical protein